MSDQLDEDIVRTARETIGKDALLMVDAGGSDALWPREEKWARKTAHMLAKYDVTWFEEPLRPGTDLFVCCLPCTAHCLCTCAA